MNPVRLLVTGGRSIAEVQRFELFKALNTFHASHPNMILAHGACPNPRLEWAPGVGWLPRKFFSADMSANDWAWSRQPNPVPVYAYPADWNQHGRSAGPKRNEFMIQAIRPTHFLAAPGGRGTADCVARAERFGAVRV